MSCVSIPMHFRHSYRSFSKPISGYGFFLLQYHTKNVPAKNTVLAIRMDELEFP